MPSVHRELSTNFNPLDLVEVIDNNQGQSNTPIEFRCAYGEINQITGYSWGDNQLRLVRGPINTILAEDATNSYITHIDQWEDIQESQAIGAIRHINERNLQEEIILPIGTIVTFNTSYIEFRLWINDPAHSLRSDNISKIVSINYNNSTCRLIELGKVEEYPGDFPLKYLSRANEEQIKQYNDAWNKLRVCTERPQVGLVIRYLGESIGLKYKKAVVIGHERNYINIKLLNRGYIHTVPFNILQISKNQSGAFNIDPSIYCTCSNCGGTREKDSVIKIEDKQYCDKTCAKEAGKYFCIDCNQWKNISETVHTGTRITCSKCVDIFYRPCAECSNIFHNNILYTHEGILLCNPCKSNHLVLIKDYSYKPTYIYNKMPWENTRYLGIELEIETMGRTQRDILSTMIKTYLKKITKEDGKNLQNLVYMKKDGSLDYGIEIVTHPFTLQSLHKHFPSKNLLEFLKNSGALVSTNCGMHVHISKEKISDNSLLRGKWFFYKCTNVIKRFSQRDNYRYCNMEEHEPYNNPYEQDEGRRTAFNVAASPKTVEIRIFKATLDYVKFISNVQFSDCFAGYIQNGCSIAFLKSNNERSIWLDFIRYAQNNKQYQIMTNYLEKARICV